MTTQDAQDITFASVKRDGDKTYLVLAGSWTVDHAAALARAVEETEHTLGGQAYEVSAKHIEKLDTSGALLLKKLLPNGRPPSDLTDTQRELLEFLPSSMEHKVPEKKQPPAAVEAFITVGKETFGARDFIWGFFVFIGQVSIRFFKNFRHPSRFRFPSIVRHIQETGVSALPIVGLLAILISMVITYQGATQLRQFGADIYTVDLTVIALLREMGVLITAIMVAGRSGSAFAAEIGVMTLRDEVNAIRTMGLDPIEVLVLPRVIALLITLPILAFLADIIGLLGGALMSFSLLDISWNQYVTRVQGVADPTVFFVGMIKAPVFAFLIALVGCYQGLNVTGSAESIGKQTTMSVVQSIFLVIMADAFFSVVFSKVGI